MQSRKYKPSDNRAFIKASSVRELLTVSVAELATVVSPQRDFESGETMFELRSVVEFINRRAASMKVCRDN